MAKLCVHPINGVTGVIQAALIKGSNNAGQMLINLSQFGPFLSLRRPTHLERVRCRAVFSSAVYDRAEHLGLSAFSFDVQDGGW